MPVVSLLVLECDFIELFVDANDWIGCVIVFGGLVDNSSLIRLPLRLPFKAVLLFKNVFDKQSVVGFSRSLTINLCNLIA